MCSGSSMSLSRWKPRSRTDSSAGSPGCASCQVTSDITTWPPCAVAAIRAARCRSIPIYPSSCGVGSPACRPIRTPTAAPPGHSCAPSARWAETQQATASAADSNTTKKLSPSVPISCPRRSDMAVRSIARWADSTSPYRCPRRLSSTVDPSMSLKSMVTVPVGSLRTPKVLAEARTARAHAQRVAYSHDSFRDHLGIDPEVHPAAELVGLHPPVRLDHPHRRQVAGAPVGVARGPRAAGYRPAHADQRFSDLDDLALPAVLGVRGKTGKADEHPEPPGVDRSGPGPAGQFGDRLLAQQRDRILVVARARLVDPHQAHWLAGRFAQHRIPRTLDHGSGHFPLAVRAGDHRCPEPDGAA